MSIHAVTEQRSPNCQRVARGVSVMRFMSDVEESRCFASELRGDLAIPFVHAGRVRMHLESGLVHSGQIPFGLVCWGAAPTKLQTIALDRGPIACCGLSISEAWLADLAERAGSNLGNLLDRLMSGASTRIVELTPGMVRTVRTLHGSEQTTGFVQSLLLEAAIVEILGQMLINGQSHRSATSREDQIFHTIRAFIDGNPTADHSIGELSRRFGLSDSRLKAGFRTQFGTSVHQYVIASRLDAAAAMLETTDLHVSQVAYRVGYSPAHFSTLFKRQFGRPPSSGRL